MTGRVSIGLIGDFDESITAHRAVPLALRQAAASTGCDLIFDWVPTPEIAGPERLARYTGLWCVPGSPYRDMEGALGAIRHAREQARPFLGTCGGFQHAVLEYARNVLGWTDADHGETAPDSPRAVIAPLACSLREVTGAVQLAAGSRIAAAYAADSAIEGYHCSYGLNPAFQDELLSGPLRATARDAAGEIRAIELVTHPFYVATLFQPERAALAQRPAPLVEALVSACAAQRAA